MKYCNKCGTELDDDAQICTGCGCLAPKKSAPKGNKINLK